MPGETALLVYPPPDFAALKDRLWRETAGDGWWADIWAGYLELTRSRSLQHVEHLEKPASWIFYVLFTAMVREAVLPQSRVLDWGGMYGQVTALLGRLGCREVYNYFLEPPPAYPLFQDRFGLKTLRGSDPNRIDLPSAWADAVVSSGVLEHVEDDGVGREDRNLAEVWRVLRPGGLFFVWNLPARWGTSELLAELLGRWHHKRRYRDGEAREALTRAGFEVLWEDKHKLLPGSILGPLGWAAGLRGVIGLDDRVSHWLFLKLLARDHALVARKTGG